MGIEQNIEGVKAYAQDELFLFVLIDTSGSMSYDGKISQVNEGMRDVIDYLKDFNNDEIDVKAKLACLSFNTTADWVSNSIIEEPENVVWYDLEANGLTAFGQACDKLQKVLTTTDKGGIMNGRGGRAPVIMLLTDGYPTDEYKASLDKLKKRGWFNAGLKVAIAIGNDCNIQLLEEFTGNNEAVFQVSNFKNLSAVIKTIAVTSSQCKSRSTTTTGLSSDGTLNISDDEKEAEKEALGQIAEDIESLESSDSSGWVI